MQPDDLYWRRPGDESPAEPPGAQLGSSGYEPYEPGAPEHGEWKRPTGQPSGPPAQRPGPEYAGPPTMAPPPAVWQPRLIVEPAPPRRLPAQDHAEIDAAEARARTFTYGVAVLTGVVLAFLLFALCGRALF